MATMTVTACSQMYVEIRAQTVIVVAIRQFAFVDFNLSIPAYVIGTVGIRQDLANSSKAERIAKVEKAFAINRKWRGEPEEIPAEIKDEIYNFRKTNCFPSRNVHFLGVWDTVGSYGIPLKALGWIGRWRFRFVNVRLGSYVKNAYHALAIDEKRKNFQPTLWKVNDDPAQNQTVEQVWFPGVHSNIGGGYADTGLSDRALVWMVLKAESCGLGLDGQFIYRRTEPNYHGELRESLKGIWKLLGQSDRNVCGPEGVNQFIHFSAEKRSAHTTNAYWPKKLLKALEMSPKPMASIVHGEKLPLYFAGYDPVGTPKGYYPENWAADD